MRNWSIRGPRRLGALAGAVVLTGALAACGGDATVDSEDSDATPTVASSPQETDTETESEESPTSSPAPDGHSGGSGGSDGDAPRDGEVNEVEEPSGEAAPRTEEDDAFLAQLADNDVDLEGHDIEDQVIAAGHEHCLAVGEGREGFLASVVGGQLEVQELTDVSPEDVARLIVESADEHYCG